MKERDFVPDKRSRIPKPQDKTILSRRTFLRGMIATATAGELALRVPDIENWLEDSKRRSRFDRFRGLSPKEREAKIEREAAEAQAFVRSREGKRILESGTDEEIFTLLTSLPPVLREHLAGTKYDIPQEQWPAFAVPLGFQLDLPRTIPAERATETSPPLKDTGYGNGVFVGPHTFLTNWHVSQRSTEAAARTDAVAKSKLALLKRQFEQGAVDALFMETRAEPEKHAILPLPEKITNADVHGSFVRVVSVDPDETSADDGTKMYPSVAIRVTRRLALFIERHSDSRYGAFRDKYRENSFLYIAPPGESMWRQMASPSGSRILDILKGNEAGHTAYLKGTSGAPVLLGDKLVGLNHQVDELSFNGQCLDVGFFHGPDELRRARSSMTYIAQQAQGGGDFGGSDFTGRFDGSRSGYPKKKK